MKFVVVPLPGARWTWELRQKGSGSVVCLSSRAWASQAETLAAVKVVRAKSSRALVYDLLGRQLQPKLVPKSGAVELQDTLAEIGRTSR